MAKLRMSAPSIVLRGLKRGWVDSEGNLQLTAFNRRIVVPPHNKPEKGLSVCPKDFYGSTDDFIKGCQFVCHGAAELAVADINLIPDATNGHLIVEIDSARHSQIKEVPFQQHNPGEALRIAGDLVNCSTVLAYSSEKMNRR